MKTYHELLRERLEELERCAAHLMAVLQEDGQDRWGGADRIKQYEKVEAKLDLTLSRIEQIRAHIPITVVVGEVTP